MEGFTYEDKTRGHGVTFTLTVDGGRVVQQAESRRHQKLLQEVRQRGMACGNLR